jgi:hypothetical protein
LQGGGVNVDANSVTVGNDVVGRDKIESAGGHIIHAGAGATVIVNPPPITSGDKQDHQRQTKEGPSSSTPAEQRAPGLVESAETLFDCGHRIRQVREEIGLVSSQFAEAIHYSSVRAFEQLEQRQGQCPESVLQRVADFSGVSLAWLKHGKGTKYPSTEFPFYPLEPAIEQIKNLATTLLCFVIELKSYEVLLIVQRSDYHWRVFDLGLGLDFWNWDEDFQYIPRFYAFLDVVHEMFAYTVESRFLPKPTVGRLKKGGEHPLRLLRSAKPDGLGWADDVRDIYHHYPAADGYGRRYGEWFLKAQDSLRHYLELYQRQNSSS